MAQNINIRRFFVSLKCIEIPPFGRNDNQVLDEVAVESGGFAAALDCHTLRYATSFRMPRSVMRNLIKVSGNLSFSRSKTHFRGFWGKILLLLLLLFSPIFSINSQDDCKNLLTKYVESMGRINAPEQGKVYFIHILMQNKYRQNTHAPNEIEMKAYLSENRMLLNSTLMQIFADTTYMFTVIPASRHIIRTEGLSGKVDSARYMNTLNMQLHLLENSAVIGCTDADRTKEIKLRPSEEIKKLHNLNEIILYYDTEKDMVRKVRLLYSTNSKLIEQTVEYKSINYNSSYRFENNSAASYIMTNAGKLKNEFADFTLIEN